MSGRESRHPSPAPISARRALLRGALTALAGLVAIAAISALIDSVGLPYSRAFNGIVAVVEGAALLVLLFIVPGRRDVRWRHPRALLWLFAGACAVALAAAIAFVLALGAALGGTHWN